MQKRHMRLLTARIIVHGQSTKTRIAPRSTKTLKHCSLTVGSSKPRNVQRNTLTPETLGGKYVVKSDDAEQYEITNPTINAPKDIICRGDPRAGRSVALEMRCFPLTPNAMKYTTRTGSHAIRWYLIRASQKKKWYQNPVVRGDHILTTKDGGVRTHRFNTRQPQNET